MLVAKNPQPFTKMQSNFADWHQLNWKLYSSQLENARSQIFQLTKAGTKGMKSSHQFQRDMVGTEFNIVMAIRRVTTNKGKSTAGVDRKLFLTPSEKLSLLDDLIGFKDINLCSPPRVKRIYILKSYGIRAEDPSVYLRLRIESFKQWF